MNCEDVTGALESRDVNGLSAAEWRACEAHATSCRHCSPHWIVFTRLAAIPADAMPPELAVQCATLAAAHEGVTRFGRVSSRLVLVGAVLAVAAAAAMLVVHRINPPPVADAVQAPTTVPGSLETTIALESSASAGVATTADEEKIDPGETAVNPFTVRVLPLQNEVKNLAGKSAVAAMYAVFLDLLRGTPGVTLLEAELNGTGSPEHIDYRITIKAEDWQGKSAGPLEVEILKPDGTVRGTFYGSYVVDIAPGCTSVPPLNGLDLAPSCKDPEGVAANLVGLLRKMVFPPDPSLERQLRARLLDRSLDVQQRLRALTDLQSFGGINGGRKALEAPNKTLRNPAVIRGAIDLATTATDPVVRATVWHAMRGTGSADLILPLLSALGQDPDSEVRLAALGTLTGEFGASPRVQAAFRATAGQDTRPLVRALAQRAGSGPNGEAAWREYILASLQDSRRSAVERIEALFFQMNLPATSSIRIFQMNPPNASSQGALDLLDDDAIKALVAVLPSAAAESSIVRDSANELVGNLRHYERPAITDMLLALLDAGGTWLSRPGAVEALGDLASRSNQPRVRAVLEKFSADDPDPRVREAAVTALAAIDAGKPLRLGVNLLAVEAGSQVPRELVGKPRIANVGRGTVAEKAGVMQGDVLLEINGTPIPPDFNVAGILETVQRGVDVDVLVYRSGESVRLTAQF